MADLNQNIWNRFKAYIETEFGVTLAEQQLDLFKVYLNELELWNKKFNLVSYKSGEEIVFRHFADSLASLKLISDDLGKNNIIADIGTGGGFPGIPIKIVFPDVKLTLIESVAKKCQFLENIKDKLSLSGVEILNERAEDTGRNEKYREKFDFVLSRALSKFSPNLEVALPLVKLGGYFLVYKTEKSAFGEEGLSSVENAVSILGGEFEEDFCYKLPGEEFTYCILSFEKIGPTPQKYPRRAGVPEKNPL